MQLSTINSQPTMSSREIADLTGKDHKHVLADVRNMLEQLGIDSAGFSAQYKDSTGRSLPCFNLDRDMTMTLVSGYSIPLRHKIVTRLSELEASQPQTIALPKTMAEALRLAADQAEQLEAQRPAVEFVNRYTLADTGSKGFREVCKLLKANENKFRTWLIESKIMYRLGGVLMGYQNHIDAGRFEVIAGVKNEHAYNSCKFTTKGITWVAGEWGKHQIE